ncbi:MAG: hypothetical protein GC193_05790 [Cryomorphaceae bacterium]|nr:hypothetical protein [Cryomorphaceae bacterium]
MKIAFLCIAIFSSFLGASQCGFGGTNYGDVTPTGVGSTFVVTNVWGGDQYSLQASAGCTYQISMCGTSWDTQITVFNPSQVVVGYNDDSCGLASFVSFTAAVSGTYVIQVNEWNCAVNFSGAEYFGVTLVSCTSLGGCNDPAACNYMPGSTDNSQCCYGQCLAFTAGGGVFDNEISWNIVNDTGVQMSSGSAVSGMNLCLPDGCYTINLFDSFGDGWNGANWQVNAGATVLGQGTMIDGSFSQGNFMVGNMDCGFPEPAQPIIVEVGTFSAAQLITDVFLGPCLDASNIQFFGAPNAIGMFSNGSAIGIEAGILLTTGNAIDAIGPNNSGSISGNNISGSSALLEAATGDFTYDAVEFTFDFVASSSQVTFEYVFASEEYPEFVCSFNDAFGFFVSGPGYAPNTNIATVPGTTDLVSIDNVNDNGAGCPPFYPQFYVDNSGGFGTQYDGHTVPLTATITTVPCATYQITIAIADVGDGAYDSAVFLRAQSFNAGIDVVVAAAAESGAQSSPSSCEPNGSFLFLNNGDPFTEPTTVSFTISGTAADGLSFESIPTTVTFQPGESAADLDVLGLLTGLTNAPESITITLDDVCSCAAPPEATLFICSLLMAPVNWLEFEANTLGPNYVECAWSTASEVNNDYFTIERSSDGLAWEDVGVVDGNGSTNLLNNYRWLDTNPLNGISYYRVRQTDFNGSQDWSVIDDVARENNKFEVMPNPGSGLFLVKGLSDGRLRIFDMQGREVGFSNIGASEILINKPASGCYIFELRLNGENEVMRARVIIN